MADPKKTSIPASMVDLVAQGLIDTVRGVTGATWFGPGQPLPPQAPKGQETRILDYQFGINQLTQARQTESGITHQELRALADYYDMLRLVIETRKDQVVGKTQFWRLRKDPGQSDKDHAKKSASDPRVKNLNQMFRYPDMERDWTTWIRMFLEEVFVLDTLSLAPKYALDGTTVLGLDVIDGSTIVKKIDENGRTPLPPSPAYQQVLKGVSAKNLTTRELIYKPRNQRAHKIYGYGPVEQIIVTVNMALRRQQTQLSNFTEGNIPEAIAQVPDTWQPADIQNFQAMFDTLAGNIAKRSRIRFVPKLEGIVFSKEKMLADQFDEWLARIVFFCFSLSPAAIVKMMNRSTAGSTKQSAEEEGLFPILDYISKSLGLVAERYMGCDDVEHVFLDEEEADAFKQAQIDKIYISIGKNSIDEVRIRCGEDPIGMGPMVVTPNGPVPLKPFLNGGTMAEGLPEHAFSPEEQLNNDKSKAVAVAAAKPAPAAAPGAKPKPKAK